MMKLLHCGDLHFGKSLKEFDLAEDQKYIADQIVSVAEQEGVDGILIAGDVYDKSVPSEAATRLLDHFLVELAKRNIRVYMVSGNHDSDDRLNFGSAFFRDSHVYISAGFNGTLQKQSLSDGNTQADIYMLPFVKASQVRYYFPEEPIASYDDAVRTIIRHTNLDKSHKNILVAHQFVAEKGSDPQIAGSESIGTRTVGLVEKIGYDCFDDFDYVALGHIHAPQRVGRDEVRYSGSPLKYSLSEVNNEKSLPLITITEGEPIRIELIPLKPLRDLRHIKGTLKELLHPDHITNTDDFIYATLTDDTVINDAMGIFQAYYPNTVHIDYDNSHSKEMDQIDITKIAESRTFSELIGDFYHQVYQCDITEEEMAIMKEAAREAGVISETD